MPLVIRILRGAYNVYRELYMTRREAGLLEDQRGKTIRAETHIKLLEVENDFLKKLDALERQKMLRKY